jgi:hypothetical protein
MGVGIESTARKQRYQSYLHVRLQALPFVRLWNFANRSGRLVRFRGVEDMFEALSLAEVSTLEAKE